MKEFILKNWVLKLVALALALLTWYYVNRELIP